MKFLALERETLERLLPGLDANLAAIPFMDRERPGSPAIKLFREARGPGLLIPTEYDGLGATAVDAIQVQRAIGARAPSLAIAATMHHFSVATLVELATTSSGMEWMLLQAIAQQNLLVASGFAEGQTGGSILSPGITAQPAAGGYTISGAKRPCSLAHSMDLLTASVLLPRASGEGTELAVMLVPATSPGIERQKFWESWVLAGAESDAVILKDVHVPDRLIFRAGDAQALDPVQVSGFLWFELLITASYLGMASALMERVIEGQRGEAADRVRLGIELEGAMAALEGVARALISGERGDAQLAQVLFARYAVQGAIERASTLAAELLGGMAYIGSSEVSYYYAAARALAFHPPGRSAMTTAFARYLSGEALRMQ